MGIKPKVIKVDLPKISPKSIIPYDSKYVPYNDAIAMYDLTSGIYKFAKPSADKLQRTLMTGTEFRNIFNKRIHNLARSKKNMFAKLLIVCLDKRQYVPKAKALTQEARREGKPVDYYPREAVICDEGMLMPDGIMEPIDTMRLARSSALHEQMADYLHLGVNGDNVPVMMDCWDMPRFAGSPCDIVVNTGNCLGEADLQLMFWTKYFKDHPIIHVTVDGDEIPIAINHMRLHGYPEKGWHWIQHWAPVPDKTTNVIDLVQLYKDLTQVSFYGEKALYKSHALTPTERGVLFMLYTFMFGTDFTSFDKWTNYVDHSFVWAGLHLSISDIRKMLKLWDNSRYQTNWLPHTEEVDWIEESMHTMQVVQRNIINLWINKNMKPHHIDSMPPSIDNLMLNRKMQGKNSPVIPDHQQLEEAVRRLRWNYLYWTNVT